MAPLPNELALVYARAGMRVFPVDMRPGRGGKPAKAPLPGYLWTQRATATITEVVEDFIDAEFRIRPDNVGVAWALGLDGYVGLDLDHEAPEWWGVLEGAPVNVTARGQHLIFRMPPGRVISNGTARFPSTGWGEVRGVGGYIVIAGPDRPGFDVDQLDRVTEFPRPEWLTDAGPNAKVIDNETLAAFVKEHAGPSKLGKLTGYRTKLERWHSPVSRHETAVEIAPWMAREAAADLVSAADAFSILEAWWMSVADRGEQRKGWVRELVSIVRWAVGVALADPDRVNRIRAEAEEEQEEGEGVDDTGPRKGKASMRDRLVDLALDHYRISRTEDDRAFLVPHEGPNVALLSGAAKRHLAAKLRTVSGKVPGRSPLDEAWTAIEGLAFDADKESLPVRVARHDQRVVIDLGTLDGIAVVVDGNGWGLSARSPVTFRRSRAMLPLAAPVVGGRLEQLFELLNVAPGSRDLFGGWLTLAYVDGMPHPIAAYRGEQGAAKTSTCESVARFVDPSQALTQRPPDDHESWDVACVSRWVVAVDNVSNISDWWSDALCRACTGAGWSRRAKYSDDDEAVTSYRRVIVLNGITLGGHLRSDLAERLLMFELLRPAAFLTEAEVRERLDAMAPAVFGALLDRLARTMAVIDDVEPDRTVRMADFDRWLAAYDKANGTKAHRQYHDVLDDVFAEQLEADAFARAVLGLLATGRCPRCSRLAGWWEGSMAELLAALQPHRAHKPSNWVGGRDQLDDSAPWPKQAHQTQGFLTRASATLRRAGVRWARKGERSKSSRPPVRLWVEEEAEFVDAVAVTPVTLVTLKPPLLCLDVCGGEEEQRGA